MIFLHSQIFKISKNFYEILRFEKILKMFIKKVNKKMIENKF
jgi:hypothetical protein